MWIGGLLILVTIFLNTKSASACNGYNLKLNYLRECNDQSIAKPVKGYTVQLDNDCNLILKGCLELSKPVKVAKGTYSIKKNPLPPIEGDIDLCDIPDFAVGPSPKEVLSTLGLPTSCPINQKKLCATGDKKINISQFKNNLGMGAGTTLVKLNINHDPGVSCTEFSITLNKANKG